MPRARYRPRQSTRKRPSTKTAASEPVAVMCGDRTSDSTACMDVAAKINAITCIYERSHSYRGRICAWPSGSPLDAGNTRRNCRGWRHIYELYVYADGLDTQKHQKERGILRRGAYMRGRGYLAAFSGMPALLRASSFRLIGQTGDKTCTCLVY